MDIVELHPGAGSGDRSNENKPRAVHHGPKPHANEGDLPFFEPIAAILALIAFFKHDGFANLGNLDVTSKFGLCAIVAVLFYTGYRMLVFVVRLWRAPVSRAMSARGHVGIEGLLSHHANGWSSFQRIAAILFMIYFVINGGFMNLRQLDGLGWYGLAAMTTVLWRLAEDIVVGCGGAAKAQHKTRLMVGILAVLAFFCGAMYFTGVGHVPAASAHGPSAPPPVSSTAIDGRKCSAESKTTAQH